jgi:hypothetical protein
MSLSMDEIDRELEEAERIMREADDTLAKSRRNREQRAQRSDKTEHDREAQEEAEERARERRLSRQKKLARRTDGRVEQQ